MSELDQKRLIDVNEVIAKKFGGKKIPTFLVNALRRFIHQDFMNSIIAKSGDGVEFCTNTIKELNVEMTVRGLENVPNDGSLYTFASNHPLGGVDGLALASIVGRNFGSVRLLVNDFLMFIKPLAPLCVPINVQGSQSRNLPSLIDQAFRSDEQMVIFPAGLCSRKIDGVIQDRAWTKTFIMKSRETGRSIVPVHFIGRNSNRFYLVARLCKIFRLKTNLAMFLLPDELYRARNSQFTIIFGKPIPAKTFDSSRTPLQWAAHVRKKVYEL
ncbi:MAG TPA: glycerol acyltransferase [Rikenellaceae bacterium]|nr:glycerol acyltransferase [Rikenellaceae bacterium]